MRINFFIIIIYFTAQNIFSESVEKQIKAIRSETKLINKSETSYKKTVKDIEGVSLEGTVATYFKSGKESRKIVAKSYGETFNSVTEFYFHREELIFVYRKFNRYDTQIGMNPPPKVVTIKETRFYFSGKKNDSSFG